MTQKKKVRLTDFNPTMPIITLNKNGFKASN